MIYCLTISFSLILFALQESNIFLGIDWMQWLHKVAQEASTLPLEEFSTQNLPSYIAEEMESPGVLFPQVSWWSSTWNSLEMLLGCADYDRSTV